MAHYAKIVDGIVDKVITADASFFNTFIDTSPGTWVETTIDGSTRKNYAGKGYTYDSIRDAFIASKPYPSWTLNETTCKWETSVSAPSDDKGYKWDEDTTNWVEIT
tara:strand:+ start:169 stop:486 length:318 start_codon:yes stop_codon:yes gene_type:complete